MEIMKERGKHGKVKPQKKNVWVEEVIRASQNPRFNFSREAVDGLTQDFEELAQKMGFSSTRELWEAAEHSCEFREDYLKALQLANQIAFHKRFQKNEAWLAITSEVS